MNQHQNHLSSTREGEDLCAALNCVRKASLCLPQDMTELTEDLKWIEESIQAALIEREEEKPLSLFSREEKL